MPVGEGVGRVGRQVVRRPHAPRQELVEARVAPLVVHLQVVPAEPTRVMAKNSSREVSFALLRMDYLRSDRNAIWSRINCSICTVACHFYEGNDEGDGIL